MRPDSTARTRRRPLLVFGLLVSALILGGVALSGVLRSGRAPTLIERATRVTDTRGWLALSPKFVFRANYRWLTNTQLLYFPQAAPGASSGFWRPVRLDLSTGARQPAAGWQTGMPSPDGRWLLRPDWSTRGLAAEALEGQARTIVWPGLLTNDRIFWLPDSSGLVRLRWNGKSSCATVYPLAGAPGKTRTVPFDGREQPPFQANGHTNGAPELLGLSHTGGALTLVSDFGAPGPAVPARPRWMQPFGAPAPPAPFSLTWDAEWVNGSISSSNFGPRFRLIEWSVLAPGAPPPRTYVLSPPPGVERQQSVFLLLSPRGDRFLWAGDGEYLPPFQAWLKRWFPKMNFTPRRTVRLWTTNLDGSAPRLLGMLSVRGKTPLPPQQNLASLALRWTPDGKRLSFLHDGALWSVPAR